jgi:type II secretory pathway pseudopilin PulG
MNPNSDMRKPLINGLGRNQVKKATSTRGFTLIESIAALGCLVVFTLILISAWHTGWDTSGDKEQARDLKLQKLAEEKSQQPNALAPIPVTPSPKEDVEKK